MREHFGRELTLPAHGAGTRAWDRQIAALKRRLRGARRAGGARNYGGAGGARNYGDAARGRRRADGGRRQAAQRGPPYRHLVRRRGRALRAALPQGRGLDPASACAISTAARSCSKASTDGDNRPVKKRPLRASVNESAARARDIDLQQSSGRATEQLITTDLWPHGLTAQGREMRACALPSRVDARGRAIGATLADLIEQEWISALKQRSGRAEIAVAVDGRPDGPARRGARPRSRAARS